MKHIITISALLLFILPYLIQANGFQSIDETKARYLYANMSIDERIVPYRYFVPEGYSPNNKYAIITFLHGIGEHGTDNEKQLLRAPIVLANDTTQSMYKFFIVAPQSPKDLSWLNTTMQTAIIQAQQEVIDKYPGIDGEHSRFIMGLSSGSYSLWETVNMHPGVYNKAVPVACGDTAIDPVNFRPTRVWAFHSSNDPAVPYNSTEMTVQKLRDDGQTVLFDDPNAGHPVDEIVLRMFPLIDWLFNDTNTGMPINPNPPVAEPPVAEPPVSAPVSQPPVAAPVAQPPVVEPPVEAPVAVNPPVSEQPQAPVAFTTPHSPPIASGIVNSATSVTMSLFGLMSFSILTL